MTQHDTNPYRYSDSNKRYMTYDWYLKSRFGGKIARIPFDIGCTCPNCDGTKGSGGCVYCKNGSASAVGSTFEEQAAHGIETACRKWKPAGFIPYFQSGSNTYGDLSVLRRSFEKAVKLDGAVMLAIATRADCLPGEAVSMLEELAEQIPLTVEMGLQTSDDRTAERINRCHTFAEFREGYAKLREAAERVNRRFPGEIAPGLPSARFSIGIHIINGLPGEDRETMLKTAEDAARLRPELLKIHLLHVLRGTKLGDDYLRGAYQPMTREEYVAVTCDQLELLPPETVLGRITGDGMADDLLAPEWSRRKTEVANEIDKELYRRGSFQGMRYDGTL